MKFLFVYLFCTVLGLTAYSQQNYLITHLDNTNGLSNNSVTGVFQDSDKLLWLNTWDGLVVYNGISFNSFKSNEFYSTSNLPNNVVTKVSEDQLRQIWICTEQGITKYNKADGSMSHFFYNNGKTNGKSADYMLAISNSNDIVCGLRLDNTLYRYNYAENRMVEIKFDQRSIGKVAKIDFDEFGRLWILSLGGSLRVFEKRGDTYHLLKNFDYAINIFHIVNHRIFFAQGSTRLFEISRNFTVKNLISIQHCVRDIQYFQGHYYIAWLFKGVQEYDAGLKPVNDLQQFFPPLQDLQVNSLTETDGSTLWITTVDKGIYKIKKRSNIFGLINDLPEKLISKSNIEAIQKMGTELWLGTRNNGILRINNLGSQSPGILKASPVKSIFEVDNSYYAFSKGHDGTLYIGSDAMGVTLYDPILKTFTPWSNIIDAPMEPDFITVRSILPQKDSSFYVGYNGGVYHGKIKRLENGTFKLVYLLPINIPGHFLKPGNNLVYALASTANWLMIGYRFAGLSLLNKQTGKTINILARTYQGSLSNNNILSLHVDKKQRIWIGTSYGLYWISENDILKPNPKFHQINNRNGLPNNNVHAILEDNAGNIWISTNHGLAKINGSSFEVIQYNLEDGLQNAEFSDNAAYKDEQGILYFGGIAGLNHFDPTKVAVNKTLSNLLITDLNIAGKTSEGVQLMVIKPRGQIVEKKYSLLRNENYFDLKVQPADGYTNMKFRYKYYLKNYDTKWHELAGSPNIEYKNIPPGNYIFYVKWSNGQGEWSVERKVFDMEIHQYFWLTTFAKVLYGLVVAIGIYIYYRIRKSRREIKHRLALENLIRVKEQKLYKEKMDFFTNITHELQTPLTLILGSIERFLYKNENSPVKHKAWNFLNIANHEAFRLQYLIHQLLEFRKAESGHLNIHLTSFNVSNLLKSIADLFEPLGEQNSLHLSIKIADDIIVTSDKEKVEMIVFNLLSNAFKYTKTDGHINFEATHDRLQQTICLTVANSGFSGPAENLNLLFEQFYTLDNADKSKISSGIGLAFSKQLTELLGGSISVASKNQWITFNVVFPTKVSNSSALLLTDTKTSEKPSYLLKSVIGAQQIIKNRISVNNELSLIENLSNSTKKTILVVEDEPAIRHLLREILNDKYIVYEAESGAKALELLKRIIPNVILSDVLMAELDGLQLCELVKNTIETCHIPFILLSALSSADQRVEGFEAGADAYLPKPFNALDLLKKIDQQIRYREAIQLFFKKDKYVPVDVESGLKAEDKLFLEKVVKVINMDISSPELDSLYLENALAMSKMTLYRKIKAFTNMTPAELIKHIRLKTAASLLKTTAITVSEIYYQTGFNNQSYFYREFKRVYGCSPKEFRDEKPNLVTPNS